MSSQMTLEVILKYSPKLLAATVTAAGALATFGIAGTAHADAGIGLHEVKNANGADVHKDPAGLYIGHLAYKDKFDTGKHDPAGVWCYGHAYGDVHQDGWVLCTDLTPSHW